MSHGRRLLHALGTARASDDAAISSKKTASLRRACAEASARTRSRGVHASACPVSWASPSGSTEGLLACHPPRSRRQTHVPVRTAKSMTVRRYRGRWHAGSVVVRAKDGVSVLPGDLFRCHALGPAVQVRTCIRTTPNAHSRRGQKHASPQNLRLSVFPRKNGLTRKFCGEITVPK